jgi:hypothetical protein
MLIRTKKPQPDGRGTIRERGGAQSGGFDEARFLLC